jgi:hypothetical protein
MRASEPVWCRPAFALAIKAGSASRASRASRASLSAASSRATGGRAAHGLRDRLDGVLPVGRLVGARAQPECRHRILRRPAVAEDPCLPRSCLIARHLGRSVGAREASALDAFRIATRNQAMRHVSRTAVSRRARLPTRGDFLTGGSGFGPQFLDLSAPGLARCRCAGRCCFTAHCDALEDATDHIVQLTPRVTITLTIHFEPHCR